MKLFSILTLLGFISDISSKIWAQNFLQNNDVLFYNFFGFTLRYNPGIAFSIPVTGVFQIVLSLALLGVLLHYAHTYWKWKITFVNISLAMITGGALGNLYERILFSSVTDFLQIAPWFPIFNIADMLIFFGVVLLLLYENKFSIFTK